MKPIQLKDTKIRIPFLDKDGKEELVLYFDRSDENVKQLYKNFDEIQKQAKKVQKDKDEDDLDAAKAFIKDAMDSLLGEGSFDKLFEISPSTNIVIIYFAQIAAGLKNEIEEDKLESIEGKYLK